MLYFYFATPSPKCPTPPNAEFIRLLIPFKNPGEVLPKTEAAATAAFALFGVEYELPLYVEQCELLPLLVEL